MRRNDGNLDKQRKHKKIRLDDLNDAASPNEEGLIETKTEIEFGDQSCQTTQSTPNYGNANVDYGKSHQRMSYDDAGPSSVQANNDQWLDDKHFMTQGPNSNANSASGSGNEDSEQRCKTKNYKALEPCSCPLCARVYSSKYFISFSIFKI